MQKFENVNNELMNPSYNMPEMNKSPYDQTERKPMMTYQMVYPEIYYKLQPYIMMVCDQMDFGSIMPNSEMVQEMTDNIYDDVCRMYPDLEEYARNNENKVNSTLELDQVIFGRRFRRRGLFRDIIDILLLSELFGRRRRSY